MTREELNIALDDIEARKNKMNMELAEKLCNVEAEYRQNVRDLKVKTNRTIADLRDECENSKLALFNKFQADKTVIQLSRKQATALLNREKEKLFSDYKAENPGETVEDVSHEPEGDETAQG